MYASVVRTEVGGAGYPSRHRRDADQRVAEHERMIRADAADFVQPDAPRVGGITPFLKVAALAEQRRLSVAPHFAMELHVHLAAAYPH